THGIKAYREAVAHNVGLAREIADEIKRRPGFQLVREPELSVVVFTREGWGIDDYNRWSDRLLQDGIAFVVPSSHHGEPNTRFAIVNPNTDLVLLNKILDSMENK
ncbi:MAG: aspartate aminotransferase family protein, partial [Rhodoluna sp.]